MYYSLLLEMLNSFRWGSDAHRSKTPHNLGGRHVPQLTVVVGVHPGSCGRLMRVIVYFTM